MQEHEVEETLNVKIEECLKASRQTSRLAGRLAGNLSLGRSAVELPKTDAVSVGLPPIQFRFKKLMRACTDMLMLSTIRRHRRVESVDIMDMAGLLYIVAAVNFFPTDVHIYVYYTPVKCYRTNL